MMIAIPAMREPGPLPSSSASPGNPGALLTPRGALPLTRLEVAARVAGVIVETQLTQTFVNRYDEPLEATYVFPLPPLGAVTRFSARVGGRRIEGRVEERAQARAAYDEAIAEGRAAAIAEEERADTFTLRVGNLPPGAEATVELLVAEQLEVVKGEATWRFPLVVAPRYVPGAALAGPSAGAGTHLDTTAVPDASRVTPPVLLPGMATPVELAVSVRLLAEPRPPREVTCSLHDVDVERQGRFVHVRLRPGQAPDRDLVLRWRTDDDDVATALFIAPDADAPTEGTFLLQVTGPAEPPAPRPRDLVILLDRSGSMEGWKMQAASRALARVLGQLHPADRVAVAAFDTGVEVLGATGLFGRPRRDEPLALRATDGKHVAALQQAVGRVRASGGTELLTPLAAAARLLVERPAADRNREAAIVLVTDGQVSHEDQILDHLGAALDHVRVCSVGVDRAVAAGLLTRLARRSGGSFELVESEARLDEALARLLAQLAPPALGDVQIELEGAELVEGSLSPRRLPDVRPDCPLTVLGRYRQAQPGPIAAHVAGTSSLGLRYEAEVPATTADLGALRATWARAHLKDLEDAFATTWARDTEQEIVALSVRCQVLSRFTAWVATDDEATVLPSRSGPLGVVQPLPFPSGWSAPETIARAPAPGSATLGPLRTQRSASAAKTRAGVLKGKFHHMSPEQVRGLPMTLASDVYVLALLLWELLHGRLFFEATSEFAILERIRDGVLPEPFLRPGLDDSGELEALVRAMLAREPERRPAPREIAARLARLAEATSALVPDALGPKLLELRERAQRRRAQSEAEIDLRPGELRLCERLSFEADYTTYLGRLEVGGVPRLVTVEVLHPDLAEDPEVVDTWRGARFDDPRLLTPRELVPLPGGQMARVIDEPFALDGRALRTLARGRGLPLGWVAGAGALVAGVLDEVGARGGHLGFAPEDLLLTADGALRLRVHVWAMDEACAIPVVQRAVVAGPGYPAQGGPDLGPAPPPAPETASSTHEAATPPTPFWKRRPG